MITDNGRVYIELAEEAECWCDPEDVSTLFQDKEGIVPVLNIGDPVRLCVDKTGNGNHLMPDEGSFYGCDNGRHYISLPIDPVTGIANLHSKADNKGDEL
jgi:hypothetical protein